jgi:hypothetical protein
VKRGRGRRGLPTGKVGGGVQRILEKEIDKREVVVYLLTIFGLFSVPAPPFRTRERRGFFASVAAGFCCPPRSGRV